MTKFERTIELKPFKPNSDFTVTCNLKIVHRTIEVKYRVAGEIEDLFIPNAKLRSERLNDLWKSTCFELFLAEVGKKEYSEFNISPSGDWNAYTFTNYREGIIEKKDVSNLEFSNAQNLTEFNVGFSVESKISNPCLGLSAVLKLASGELTYWAYKHSGDKPDFHLRENFLEI